MDSFTDLMRESFESLRVGIFKEFLIVSLATKYGRPEIERRVTAWNASSFFQEESLREEVHAGAAYRIIGRI